MKLFKYFDIFFLVHTVNIYDILVADFRKVQHSGKEFL